MFEDRSQRVNETKQIKFLILNLNLGLNKSMNLKDVKFLFNYTYDGKWDKKNMKIDLKKCSSHPAHLTYFVGSVILSPLNPSHKFQLTIQEASFI